MPYLVDGNNLAHALRLSREGLADRAACARIVTEFCRRVGARATLVFDGPAREGAERPAGGERVRVLFSEGRTADEVILGLLGRSKSSRDYTVVTSDKSLGDKARHLGVAIERSHEFAHRLRSLPAEGSDDDLKPETRESDAEIDAGLEAFTGPRPGSR